MKVKGLKWWVGGGVFLVFCFLLSLMPTYVDESPVFAVLTHVPFGWWHFLTRNIPQMTLNWNSIMTGIVCSVLGLLLANWFFGALFKQVQKSKKPDVPLRAWRWRWTICMYAGLWILFVIAFGVAGVFEHTTWLMQYRRPWYEPQPGRSFEFALGIHAIEETVRENSDNFAAAQKSLLSETNLMLARRTLAIENYDVVFYHDSSNRVAAFLVIPRKLPSGTEARFYTQVLREEDYPGGIRPISELQKTTAELDKKYPASR